MADFIARIQPLELKNIPIFRSVAEAPIQESRQHDSKIAQEDEANLARFGKKQQLKRRFGLLSIIALTCNLMITWEGVLIVMAEGLGNGGPLGLITTFIFAWVGIAAQGLMMAEMGSMIPVSGGQYNWVAVLAPPSCARFLSYICGWITTIAWQASTASSIYFSGTFIQGLAILNWPNYVPTNWQTTLMFYAVILLALFVNMALARLLPALESAQLIIHILGFFAILIPLAYLGPKVPARDVFEVFVNQGGWSSRGLTFFVGINNTMLTLIGLDGATHLAEEIEDASRVIPKAIIIATIIAGITGLATLIVALFSIDNLDAVLHSPTGFPFMEIFRESVGSASGATGMIVVIAIVIVLTTIGNIATSSRMLWAFARERAVPFHTRVAKVSTRSSLPFVSIGVTVVVNALLALINIGSSAAFNAFTSLTVSAFYVSFMLATGSILWRKITRQHMHYGPFKLGVFGIPIGIFSMAYSSIGAFFSLWPQMVNPSLKEMNWAVVIFAGSLGFSLLYWIFWARKEYTGPVIEVTVEQVAMEHQT